MVWEELWELVAMECVVSAIANREGARKRQQKFATSVRMETSAKSIREGGSSAMTKTVLKRRSKGMPVVGSRVRV